MLVLVVNVYCCVACCLDLRGLVQDNSIARISGVEHLVNLQVLALGRNQISEFRDVQVCCMYVSVVSPRLAVSPWCA